MTMSMITAVLAAALAAGLPQQTDTTFAVTSGGSLAVAGMSGSVVIRSWDREAMRVRASHAADARIDVRSRGGNVTLEARHARTPESDVSYDIMVPRSFSINIDGMKMPVTVEGVQGSVRVHNMQGDITLRRVTGDVEAESVGGAVTLDGVRGRVSATTINQTVTLTDVRGDVSASTVNGGIVMHGMDARRVEASTVNGFVEYLGAVYDGGRYYLGAHNGRITMGIPDGGNAIVSISARTGQVHSAFPVPAGNVRDGRLSFTLGAGTATIELESFNGAVHLVRPPGR
jgi:DUF4097 and DUF4098 domain-containing protein YvlB